MTTTFPLADAHVVVLRSDQTNPLAVCRSPHRTLEELRASALDFLRKEIGAGVLSEEHLDHLEIGIRQLDGKILGLSVRDSSPSGRKLVWEFVLVPAELLPPLNNLKEV